MDDMLIGIKVAVVGICGSLTAFWGWFGWLICGWIFCMAMDYITGSAAACKNGEWSSSVAREGIWHKVGQIVAVMVAGLLDLVVGHLLGNIPVTLPFTYTVLICPLVVTWYILTEAGSIIENAGALGAPIPSWMAKTVDTLQDAVDEAGEKIAPENKKE